jgi:hypothetical protein
MSLMTDPIDTIWFSKYPGKHGKSPAQFMIDGVAKTDSIDSFIGKIKMKELSVILW